MIIREHLDRSSNPSVHPHRSYRTLRDGSFGVRCPRHFVPGYDRAVPPGHWPVALTPPNAHGTAPISDRTVSYTCLPGYLSIKPAEQDCWEEIGLFSRFESPLNRGRAQRQGRFPNLGI